MSDETTVVLFSVDGMRPDAMMAADTPTMHRLVQTGASSLEARTVMPSVTLPCHQSMFRGVDVPRHGITSNHFQPLARPVPSILDAAHAAGKRTGFFYNWGPLRDLSEPESVDVAYFWRDCKSADGDARVAQVAAQHAVERPFDLMVVYLGWTDECAHRNDWMSQAYLDAIAAADRCIGHVLEACGSTGRPVTALVLSDHGGHGRSHGTDCAEDMTIPWVLAGHGVRAGVTLTQPVRVFDTCPTIAALLGVPPADEWEGHAVIEAFVR